jgi:putative redox protein
MEEIVSDGLRLPARFARPAGAARVPALLLLPGFPRGTGGAAMAGHTYPPLAERIAREAGWAALTFQYRGTGGAEGDFSIDGWLADVRAAVDALCARSDIASVWLAGFRLGGSLAVVTAADDARVRGIATFAAPESLETWVPDANAFLEYCRRVGVIRSAGFPPDVAAWARAIARLDMSAAARRVPPRPWLLVHGTDDDVVPIAHARRLAAAASAEGDVEVREVHQGAHRLRHDPRAIAMLLGWLDRQG